MVSSSWIPTADEEDDGDEQCGWEKLVRPGLKTGDLQPTGGELDEENKGHQDGAEGQAKAKIGPPARGEMEAEGAEGAAVEEAPGQGHAGEDGKQHAEDADDHLHAAIGEEVNWQAHQAGQQELGQPGEDNQQQDHQDQAPQRAQAALGAVPKNGEDEVHRVRFPLNFGDKSGSNRQASPSLAGLLGGRGEIGAFHRLPGLGGVDLDVFAEQG